MAPVNIEVNSAVLIKFGGIVLNTLQKRVEISFTGFGNKPYIMYEDKKYVHKGRTDYNDRDYYLFGIPEFKPIVKRSPEDSIYAFKGYSETEIRVLGSICHEALRIANREIFIDQICYEEN